MTGKNDDPQIQPTHSSPVSERSTGLQLSRRNLLHATLATAGGAAFLLSTMEPAAAKMPQKASQYQDTPKGKAMCSNCAHFEPPSGCGIVAGKISPNGWCRFYVKK